ncbi:hypothetical protein OAV88_03090 [bacterium]|nr:hypothetical protein [bacterium]
MYEYTDILRSTASFQLSLSCLKPEKLSLSSSDTQPHCLMTLIENKKKRKISLSIICYDEQHRYLTLYGLVPTLSLSLLLKT